MAADLLTPLRDHLVAEGVVRVPRVAGAQATLWLEPRDGAPAPGEGQNVVERSDVVVAAFRATGIAPNRHEGFVRKEAVDFWVRAQRPSAAFAFDDLLQAALSDRRHWMMGSELIEESLMFRALQRVGADDKGWTFTTEYMFERWE